MTQRFPVNTVEFRVKYAENSPIKPKQHNFSCAEKPMFTFSARHLADNKTQFFLYSEDKTAPLAMVCPAYNHLCRATGEVALLAVLHRSNVPSKLEERLWLALYLSDFLFRLLRRTEPSKKSK